MADGNKKVIKVGVKIGGGPGNGYQWDADIFSNAFEEAMSFLSEEQYDHMASQVRELALQPDPTHSLTVDVRPIEDFFEIRDKGGVLGNLNVRVFFFVRHEARKIVVLGAIKKENNGPTPIGDKFRMRRRMRTYLEDHPLAT